MKAFKVLMPFTGIKCVVNFVLDPVVKPRDDDSFMQVISGIGIMSAPQKNVLKPRSFCDSKAGLCTKLFSRLICKQGMIFCSVFFMFTSFLWAQSSQAKSPFPATVEKKHTAFLKPYRTLLLAPELGGRLKEVNLNEGDVLKETKQAFCIDDTFSALALAQLENSILSAQKNSEQIELLLALSKRKYEYEKLELERIQSLKKLDRATEEELDARKLSADLALLEQQRAKKAKENSLLELALLELKRSEALEHQARYKVFASKGWTVVKRLREPQSLLAAGEPVLELAKLNELRIQFHLSIEELEQVEKALYRLTKENSDELLKAELFSVAPNVDELSRKVPVELKVPADGLRAGTKLELSILLPHPQRALSLPASCLGRYLGEPYLESTDGTRRPIFVLRENADTITFLPSKDFPKDFLAVPISLRKTEESKTLSKENAQENNAQENNAQERKSQIKETKAP